MAPKSAARRERGQQAPTQTGSSKMKKVETAAKVASAKIEPTERSMPPRQHDNGQAGDDDREFAELAGRIAQRRTA